MVKEENQVLLKKVDNLQESFQFVKISCEAKVANELRDLREKEKELHDLKDHLKRDEEKKLAEELQRLKKMEKQFEAFNALEEERKADEV